MLLYEKNFYRVASVASKFLTPPSGGGWVPFGVNHDNFNIHVNEHDKLGGKATHGGYWDPASNNIHPITGHLDSVNHDHWFIQDALKSKLGSMYAKTKAKIEAALVYVVNNFLYEAVSLQSRYRRNVNVSPLAYRLLPPGMKLDKLIAKGVMIHDNSQRDEKDATPLRMTFSIPDSPEGVGYHHIEADEDTLKGLMSSLDKGEFDAFENENVRWHRR